MNSANFNTYAGYFLATVFAVMTIGMLSDAIFHSEVPETPGFAIAAAESEAAGGEAAGGGEAAAPELIGPLLASADLAKGENAYKKCAACHTWENGGANKVGPNLWSIVNRPIASHEGFGYSAALKAYAEGGKVWDYESLSAFIQNPKKAVPGTAMGFAGIKSAEERANLIAWMRTHADAPAPLPGS